jgi:hypothetical protein
MKSCNANLGSVAQACDALKFSLEMISGTEKKLLTADQENASAQN